MKWRRRKSKYEIKIRKKGRELVISPLTFSTSIRSQHMLKLYCSLCVCVCVWSVAHIVVLNACTCQFENKLLLHATTSTAFLRLQQSLLSLALHSFLFSFHYAARWANIFFVIVIWSRVPFNRKMKEKKNRLHTGFTRSKCVTVCVCLWIYLLQVTCFFFFVLNNFAGIVNIWLELF